MSWIDVAAIVVIVLSLLLGVMRGLVRELFSLTSWVLAGVIAVIYGPVAARYVPEILPGPLFTSVAGFLVVFVIALIVLGVVGLLVGRLIRAAGLGAGDRFLGGVFGILRGIIIMAIAVLVGGLTPMREEPSWRHSMIVPPLESLVVAMRPYLPSAISERVRTSRVE